MAEHTSVFTALLRDIDGTGLWLIPIFLENECWTCSRVHVVPTILSYIREVSVDGEPLECVEGIATEILKCLGMWSRLVLLAGANAPTYRREIVDQGGKVRGLEPDPNANASNPQNFKVYLMAAPHPSDNTKHHLFCRSCPTSPRNASDPSSTESCTCLEVAQERFIDPPTTLVALLGPGHSVHRLCCTFMGCAQKRGWMMLTY